MSASIKGYRRAFEKSQIYIDSLSEYEVPVDVFNHLDKIGVLVATVEEYLEFCRADKIESALKIQDARCIFDPKTNHYIIIYNHKKPASRIRFSLAHELGHIIMGHLSDEVTEINRGGLDDHTYYFYEGEANVFAGNFLAPPILIYERARETNGKISISSIAGLFKLSELAAERRLQDFRCWTRKNAFSSEVSIRKKYGVFSHPRYCNKCKCLFYGAKTKHCPICGNSRLSKFKGAPVMEYKKVSLNENGKAVICPHCENEEILDEGEYCHICGKLLINRCESGVFDDEGKWVNHCRGHKPLPGNARYCPYCGEETTFFKNGVLKAWNYQDSTGEFEEITDDGLPF